MFVTYQNGNYRVLLNLTDGTKIRYNNEDNLKPTRPESIDVKITNQCSHSCPFCHENSLPHGKKASYEAIDAFVKTLPPYIEIAVGGGNLMEDPGHTLYFLQELKKVHAIPSITVRQDDFINNIKLISFWKKQNLIYGIGVSLSDSSDPKLIPCLKSCPTAVLHVIAGIFTEEDYKNLKDNDLKILILGYKTIRRGKIYLEECLDDICWNQVFLSDYYDNFKKDFNTIAFDNLALEQLDIREKTSLAEWEKYYCGDDGQYTFYVDLVEEQYAKNSTSAIRCNITNILGQKYSVQEMYNIIRGVEILKELRNDKY